MKRLNKSISALAIAVVCQFIILFGVAMFNQNMLMGFPIAVRAVLMLVTQWLFLIVPIIFIHKNKEKLSDIGFSSVKIPLQILIGVIIAIIMCLAFTIFPIFMGLRDMVSSTRYTENWQFVYKFFYSIFGVALVEEVFFRGYIFKKLLDIKNSKWIAIIVSSVIFGLFHIFQGNIIQIFITTIFGMLYCLFRDKIKHCTILSLVFAHGIYDALIVLCVSVL